MKWVNEDEFFSQLDNNPSGVYLVDTFENGQRENSAIFSTKKKVEGYLSALPDTCTACVCPFVIDEPDFGNVSQPN